MLKLISASIVATVLALPASAATLLAYDTVNGPSVAASIVAQPLNGSDLTRGPGLTQNAGSDFNSRGWTGASLLDASLNGNFLEWSLSTSDHFTAESIEIAYDRSPTGPMSLALFASVDGGSYTSIFTDNAVADNSEINIIDLTTGPLDFGTISSVTFRLFGWGATSSAGTFDIETGNVGEGGQFGLVVLGVVPLPAGLPLMAGALVLLGLVRRKR